MNGFLGILDQYDDSGAFLRDSLNTHGGGKVPSAMQGGADMSKVGSGRDSDYALSFPTERGMLRRFPIVDRANTAMSALYFAEYGHQLPADAQKTAAVALQGRPQAYELPVPPAVEDCAEGVSLS